MANLEKIAVQVLDQEFESCNGFSHEYHGNVLYYCMADFIHHFQLQHGGGCGSSSRCSILPALCKSPDLGL
jgi:hypothetical protein